MPARRRTRRVALAVARIGVLGTVGLVAATTFSNSNQVVAVAAMITGAVALLVEAWPVMFPMSGQVVAGPEAHADELASVLAAEWRDEARVRQLRDPSLLPMAWAGTGRNVMDRPEAVVGVGAPTPIRLKLAGHASGDLDDAGGELARAYARIPSGRLVVLGEPGSGKTVLAITLTLGLLRARRPAAAVPVLLSASSWDPVSQSLDSWIVKAIAGNYYNGRTDIPELLLSQDLLVPVLDGLDEIPEDLRRSAIRSINEAVQARRPIVLTCRSVEYEDLIVGGAPLLRRAPVIEVSPVAAPDTIAYLQSIDWPGGTVWVVTPPSSSAAGGSIPGTRLRTSSSAR